MAYLSFPVSPAGLEVPVLIGLDGQNTVTRLNGGLSVPPPVLVRGILDTGSTLTAVSSWILRKLGLPKLASASTHTMTGSVAVDLYSVSLSIIDPQQGGSAWLTEEAILVTELSAVLPDADVLVGLDILLKCKLLLDGPARQFTLEF
jgi:hypothetical protein